MPCKLREVLEVWDTCSLNIDPLWECELPESVDAQAKAHFYEELFYSRGIFSDGMSTIVTPVIVTE